MNCIRTFSRTWLPVLAMLWCARPALIRDADGFVPGPSAAAGTAAVEPDGLRLRLELRLSPVARRRNAALSPRPAASPHDCRFDSAIVTAPPPRTVALTFDDGPNPGETEFILQTLTRHGVQASFFPIGAKAAAHPELIELTRQAGRFLIGNHTWAHANFHEISAEAQFSEVARAGFLVDEEQGAKLFRYPYGNASCASEEYLHAQGYQIVGWHVDSCDWAFDQTGSVNDVDARICKVKTPFLHDYVGHVVSQVMERQGGIILMHQGHPNTVRQLDAVLTRLEDLGFRFAGIDDPEFGTSLR